MKALKFLSQISERTRKLMKEAISKSAELNKECGFSFCDDSLSPIFCEAPSYVNIPSCKTGKLKGGFHVHLKSDGISGMDMVSSIATDTDVDCIGYKDDSVYCYDINSLKERDKELSKQIKVEYKAALESTDSDIEVGKLLSAIAKKAKLQFKQPPFHEL